MVGGAGPSLTGIGGPGRLVPGLSVPGPLGGRHLNDWSGGGGAEGSHVDGVVDGSGASMEKGCREAGAARVH